VDDRADDRFPASDDVITCQRDRVVDPSGGAVLLELDTQTYCSRWTIALSASVPCDVAATIRIGESCEAEPYEVKTSTTIDSWKANRLIDAVWIFTGLAHRIWLHVTHGASVSVNIQAKVIADRQAVTPDVVVMPGTQVVP
jgi:hypothetical protein